MIQIIFGTMMNLIATILQIISYPVNIVITNALPNISDKLTSVINVFSTIFNGMAWALGLLPPNLLPVLIFIITVEIAKHTIFVSTHTLIKVWNLFQRLKFW